MATHEQEIASLRKSSDKIEGAIKELQDKILEVGGVRLRAQQAKVDSILSQIDTLNDQTTKLTVARSAAEKNIEKTRKVVEKTEQELEETNTKRDEIETEKEEKTQIAIGIKSRCEEAQSLMDFKKSALDELKIEVDQNDNTIKQLRKMEVEMKNRMDQKTGERANNERAVTHWERQIKELSLQKLGLSVEEDEEELPVFPEEELHDVDVEVMEAEIADMEGGKCVRAAFPKREEYLTNASFHSPTGSCCAESRSARRVQATARRVRGSRHGSRPGNACPRRCQGGLRHLAQEATRGVHERLHCHLFETQRDVPNDHPWRQH